MVKEANLFRKQADKADNMAPATPDADASRSFSSLAQAYRSQADALKKITRRKIKKEDGKRKNAKAERGATAEGKQVAEMIFRCWSSIRSLFRAFRPALYPNPSPCAFGTYRSEDAQWAEARC
jgi:hypothetical protein